MCVSLLQLTVWKRPGGSQGPGWWNSFSLLESEAHDRSHSGRKGFRCFSVYLWLLRGLVMWQSYALWLPMSSGHIEGLQWCQHRYQCWKQTNRKTTKSSSKVKNLAFSYFKWYKTKLFEGDSLYTDQVIVVRKGHFFCYCFSQKSLLIIYKPVMLWDKLENHWTEVRAFMNCSRSALWVQRFVWGLIVWKDPGLEKGLSS